MAGLVKSNRSSREASWHKHSKSLRTLSRFVISERERERFCSIFVFVNVCIRDVEREIKEQMSSRN